MATTAPNYGAILKQAQSQVNPGYKGVIESTAAERQPLINRYQGILDQINANQQAAISGQQQVTSREFGARGIPLSSGVFGQTLETKLNPIRSQYSGILAQTGAEREGALADIATRIAGLKTQRAQSAIEQAMNLYGTQYGGYQSGLQRTFQAQQSALDRAAQLRASAASAPLSIPIPKAPAAAKVNYAAELQDDIRQWLSGKVPNVNYLTLVREYAPYLTQSQILSIYNKSAGQLFGAPKESQAEITKLYNAYRGK